MRRITLIEYRTLPGVSLADAEMRAIRSLIPSVRIAPSIVGSGRYDLTPGADVGALNLGDLAIEIRPKIPIGRLLFMVSYAIDPRRWRDIPFDFASDASLVEAIIPGFVAQVRRAFARGVLQGYRTEEEALPTVRGRIRFDDQIRAHYGRLPPVEVRYDEFTEDIEENRLIKAAIARLGRLRIRAESSRRALRAFDAGLETVRLIPYDPRRLRTITYTRLNAQYRPAVELAKLIIRATSFDLGHGDTRASSFLLNMNAVFEDFVTIALRESLALTERTFPQNAAGRPLCLDRSGLIHLKPDLSWWDGTACTFVGDVKYKRASVEGVVHPDLYQLLAYAVATDLPGGMLIYAAGEDVDVVHAIAQLPKRLEVVTLHCDGSEADILMQVGEIAERIRRLRATALAAMMPSEFTG